MNPKQQPHSEIELSGTTSSSSNSEIVVTRTAVNDATDPATTRMGNTSRNGVDNMNDENEGVLEEESNTVSDPLENSSNSSKEEEAPNTMLHLLSVGQAATLLTADILGTGLLALPENVNVLGRPVGLTFLILNLPINWFAGYWLCLAANGIEDDDNKERMSEQHQTPSQTSLPRKRRQKQRRRGEGRGFNKIFGRQEYDNVHTRDEVVIEKVDVGQEGDEQSPEKEFFQDEYEESTSSEALAVSMPTTIRRRKSGNNEHSPSVVTTPLEDDADEATNAFEEGVDGNFNVPISSMTTAPLNDLIDLTRLLFQNRNVGGDLTDATTTGTFCSATRIVMMIFYVNVFLVLGDYLLVMAKAVSAIFDDDICFAHAGLLATIMMFGLTQIRRMKDLGRSITFISLASLAIVVVLCLSASEEQQVMETEEQQEEESDVPWLRKLSAIASIGFATGTNKLLLNVRHEMSNRHHAPMTLAISMFIFGTVYVGIALLAGPNPPGFLFEAIAEHSMERRIAGLFLWLHIAVSYAINSQAICASLVSNFTSSDGDSTAPNINIGLGNKGIDDNDEIVASFTNDTKIPNTSTPNQQATSSREEEPNQSQPNHDHYKIHSSKRRQRDWLCLTASLAISSYIVANAIPFFKDLVALIGALTSIPLTLIIPAIQYRKYMKYPLLTWGRFSTRTAPYSYNTATESTTTTMIHEGGEDDDFVTNENAIGATPTNSIQAEYPDDYQQGEKLTEYACPSVPPSTTYCHNLKDSPTGSYALLVFGILFLVVGLIGAVGSIILDWDEHSGKPFACALG